MYSGKRVLPVGMPVRVEVDAVIAAPVEKNPFWYDIQFSDSHIERIPITRITAHDDEPRAHLDANGDVTILQPRLSRAGALNLFHWLRTNLAELAADQVEQEESEVSPE